MSSSSLDQLETETEEQVRLQECKTNSRPWKKWGPYLSERQWGTVREDYSADGNCWDYFPHEHARSRTYRWGEDGLLGICDDQGFLCLALALWNGRDPILKERLFGLTGPQGNHGEDVKECYYYLDSTPTHSYMKALYKYPMKTFPYGLLYTENKRRGKNEKEFELEDTNIFKHGYWDILVEYAKANPQDILCLYTVTNRSSEDAILHLMPTLWFRNTWIWGDKRDSTVKPRITAEAAGKMFCCHEHLGKYSWNVGKTPEGDFPFMMFTENETNAELLFNFKNNTPYTKDAFHRFIIDKDKKAISPKQRGTKCAALYILKVAAGCTVEIRNRLCHRDEVPLQILSVEKFNSIINQRIEEADAFYNQEFPAGMTTEQVNVARQAYAGLLWTKQFYYYNVSQWLTGDLHMPKPPDKRLKGRNHDWTHLYNCEVISVPDKWEYPWYASWDLAFHMIPLMEVDPEFAKEQMVLFLREWYMHPNGQIPAYEFAFGDVNPPVHAWACLKVYKTSGSRGYKDNYFLQRCFHKLLLNFTWWVNRKDPEGKNIFSGGFLGLDNIGVFDRSKPLPTGGELEQADGTAWMAFFALTMMEMAMELSFFDKVYIDLATKFLEHFVTIVDAINQSARGQGLWDVQDGFYYDHLRLGDEAIPIKVRSLVGIVPLFSCLVLEKHAIDKLPDFAEHLEWFEKHRLDLVTKISYLTPSGRDNSRRLLAIPTHQQLSRVLDYLLDENEFLSPYGIRSLSKIHYYRPFSLKVDNQEYRVDYVPGESNSFLFGGNSNWRGPVWLCMNYLIIECLERYDYFFGESFIVECPKGSGKMMRLCDVAEELRERIISLFLPDEKGKRPCHGDNKLYSEDPFWKDLVLFYEYFHGDTGRGCGASHQTGWTAIVVQMLKEVATLQVSKFPDLMERKISQAPPNFKISDDEI